jgi:glycosyltransferase involved in cell wall biosynthesis
MPYLDQRRVRVVFNGVSDMSAELLRPARQIRRIGVIGRIEEQKGQVEFVTAAKVVAAHFPDCHFRIIGVPMFSGADYYNLVVRESRDLQVEFHGWKDDVRSTLADLDLLIVPSKNVEATTRVILEAFSAQVPVVAFPSGGILEVLQDEVTGFLTAASTSEALATRIVEVLGKSPAELRAVTARARQEWEKRFTLGGYRAQICEVLDRALRT